jgi:PAS domain S-box-containing protein
MNAPEREYSRFRDSIGRTFIIRILLFSSLVTLIGTSIQLYVDFSGDVDSVERLLELIDTSYLESVSNSLWSYDEAQTHYLLKGILSLPDVQHVEIRKENTTVFQVGEVDQANTIQKRFPLIYKFRGEDRYLGELLVNASLRGVYSRTRKRILVILSTQAIKTFLVSAFIYLLFYLIIGKHLKSMAVYMTSLDFSQLSLPLKLKRRPTLFNDELEVLVQSINSMRDNIIHDFDQRARFENALRQSELKYRALFENATRSVFIYHVDTMTIVDVNPATSALYGYSNEELVGKSFLSLNADRDDVEKEESEISSGSFHNQPDIKWHKKKNGEIFPVEVDEYTLELNDARVGYTIVNDITARAKAEEEIRISLKEKETLLKEIHHRVKNNLNVISSLLNLHRASAPNDETRDALRESQARIFAMSAVHEALYNNDSLAEIDLMDYLRRLFMALVQTYSVAESRIRLSIGGDDVKVDITIASPLGLTINELITNSIKYAFPDNREGEISVVLHKSGGALELIVADNGVGIDGETDWKTENTLGMKLIRRLIENQLDGTIELDVTQGTKFVIRVELESKSG